MTEILNPGPISNGMLENKARRGTDLEFMEDRSDASREIPSPPAAESLEEVGGKAGASGSVGEALYMMS